MTWIELFETVEEMRNAQKNYFATKEPKWLGIAKYLEGQVDELIPKAIAYLKSQLPKQ